VERSLAGAPLTKLNRPWPIKAKALPIEGIDIISLVESAGAKRAGKWGDTHKYYCPLHEDRKDASLTVNARTGGWMCWAGCSRGGPIQFVMAWKRCDYKDALKWLERHR
jgi:DNA primase